MNPTNCHVEQAEQAEQVEIARSLATADMTRIVLRPLASSLRLGFFAFGTGTVLLATLDNVSRVFAFLARDVGAATGLTLLGATWIARP